jgi:hypothetical protein
MRSATQGGLVVAVLLPQFLAEFGILFGHGRLAELAGDDVVVGTVSHIIGDRGAGVADAAASHRAAA